MTKKKLKIDFTITLDPAEDDCLYQITKVDVETTDFYAKTRAYLEDLLSCEDFQDTTKVSFKSVDQDLDEIQ